MFDILKHPWDDLANLLGVVLVVIAFWKYNSNKVLRDSNEDFKVRIELLEKKITDFEGEMEKLKKDNGSMAHLIKTSLILYFESNPDEAVKLAKAKI